MTWESTSVDKAIANAYWEDFKQREGEQASKILEALNFTIIKDTRSPYLFINVKLANGPFFTLVEEHAAMGIPGFVSNIGGILGVYMGKQRPLF